MPDHIHLHKNHINDNAVILLLLVPSIVFFVTLAALALLQPTPTQTQVLSTQTK